MRLKLKNTSGESVTLIIKPDDTFTDLRERVAEELGLRLDLSDIVNGEHYLETQRVLDFFSQLPNAGTGDDSLVGGYPANLECIVPGCNKKKFSHPENSFFEFPTEEIRNHQWALYCQRLLGESGKKRLNITSTSRICSDHFKPEQFVKNAATILKKTAVPCINPEICSKFLNTNSKITLHNFSDSNNILSNCSLDNSSLSDFDSSSLIQLKREKKPLCRLCAKHSNNSVFIFDNADENISLTSKINSCLPLEISIADHLPKQICSQCCISLEKFYKFSESTVEAHMKLKEKNNADSNGWIMLADWKDDTNESLDVSLMCDFSDENLIEPKNPCKLCQSGVMSQTSLPLSDKTIKSNDYESDEPDITDEFTNRDNTDLTVCEIGSINVDNVLTVKSVDRINGLKPLSDLNGSCSPIKIRFEAKNVNKDSSDNWEAADSAFGYSCMLCSADFRSSADLFPHSLMHSDNGHYVCCLCNEVCSSKNDLAVHFKSHSVVTSDMIYQCHTCGIGSRSLSMFEIHNCTSANWTLNRCNICHKTFRSESRLKFHKKFHENGSKPGKCELCPKVFGDEMKLYKHVTYLHGQGKEKKSHCCEECGKVFRTVSYLKYHQRVHQGESYLKPYSCDVCGKSFIRRSMLRNHITSVHKTLSVETECFMCKICYELFPCSASVFIHLERMHTLVNSESSYESFTSNKIYSCEFCKRCFTSSEHINSHRSKHRNDSPYECKHCLSEFVSSRELESHHLSDHSDSISEEYALDFSTPLLFLCEYCDRSFVSSIKYTEHLTVHYGPTPYVCRFCDEKFSTIDDLTSHRTTQHADCESISNVLNYYRPHECHYCNKSFAIEDALIKHIRMHTGEKPFICDQCGKGFSQSSGLYTHQKVHSNERPYTCSICPRRFKIKGDRDIHVRKHSGERPYKCEFCGKAFMTQHVYSQHRKIHTGERPYKCDVCHIAFRRSHVLTVHKRIHTGEKPNSCDICGKCYRQKGDMLKHKRIQHGAPRSAPPAEIL